jgi:rSAM/selenodomain-associated transferase 1
MSCNQQSLIIFTRYPEVGKTKTRLIPVIGAEKAANLQRRMTELTLKTAEELKLRLALNIYIYFAGGNLNLMKKWLGKNWLFYPQSEGDLGQKMYSALIDSFARKNQASIIIGIDCPTLNMEILTRAFQKIKNYDLVIGKADDGGYYLIGLNQPRLDLFTNINWGTSRVFEQTITIAKELNLSIYNLPILRDIDRPEDLQFYQYDEKRN